MPTFKWTPDSVVHLDAKSSAHPIHGEIRGLRGEATVDVQDGKIVPGPGTTAYIEADTTALQTGKKLEDIALRKQIDVKKYPTVRYEVRSADGGPEAFKISGAFTFHGVTQEFVEEVRATIDNGTLRVEGEHTFDIRDFGVQPFKILTMKIYPEVHLVVSLVGTEGSGYTPAWG
ncbi:MAG: YceI family protein [Acidimicrobiales bacterium]